MALSLSLPENPHMHEEAKARATIIFQHIESYLHGRIGVTQSAQDILTAFYQDVESFTSREHPGGSVEGHLSVLWMTILAVAIQLPTVEQGHQNQQSHSHMQRLVELLLVIKSHQLPTNISPAAMKILRDFESQWGQCFWVDLPVFGMMVHDTQECDPALADVMVEIQGHLVTVNQGANLYSLSEWASLKKFLRLCKDMGVMDLLL
ncbi:hypothetical protein TruAng_007906 [Truncatella angustata]|nr:hypothetical protein TruAng_007906 [Truncatella angustata]